MPIPVQNACHETPPAISGPTTNWPAEPPAMPNIWVNPISVAARDGGKLVVAIYTAPIKRKHAAGALQQPSDARHLAVPGREQQRADADRRGAERDDHPRAETIHRDAGHEAERRVAVVEEADQRGHTQRAEAEGVRELRHHHRGRRAQRVLIEVVNGGHQPRRNRRPHRL